MFQTPFNHVLDTIQSVMFQLPFSNSQEGDIDEGLGVNGPPIATVTRAAETSLAGAEGLIIANASCFEFYCVEVLHKQSDGITSEISEVVILCLLPV